MKVYRLVSGLTLFLGIQIANCKSISEIYEGKPLIVGGFAARQGQFPFQLSLKVAGQHSCGASLVEVNGQLVALTAAQCINSTSITQYTLVAGEYNLDEVSGIEQTRDVQRIFIYPNYINTAPYHGDIAIMFTTQSFDLNDNVQSISLPEEGKSTDGNVTVTGWGRLWVEGPYANLLHYISVPVVNNTVCKAAWAGLGSEIIDGQLCAGDPWGGDSPCNGDNGGPAISDDGYLAGITSWNYGCGHPMYPGIFTKVSQYIGWIQGTVTDFMNENNQRKRAQA